MFRLLGISFIVKVDYYGTVQCDYCDKSPKSLTLYSVKREYNKLVTTQINRFCSDECVNCWTLKHAI